MSQLKLTADSGGGTVAIKAPASTTSNSAFELTLPGTGSSTLATTATAGKILQVIQTFKNDAASVTSNSFVDLPGMSATITPSSNSNKVLVRFSLCLSSAYNPVIHINLLRGSTNIAMPSTTPTQYSTMMAYSDGDKIYQQGYEFLDSPATTSATTYKLQWRNNSAGYTSKLNQYYNQTNYVGTSTLTLMEVAA